MQFNFIAGKSFIKDDRRKRFGIQQQPSNGEYKEFNIDTSKLYNELYTAIKKDKLTSTKTAELRLNPDKIEAAVKRASLKAPPSIANFYTTHKVGIVKPKIKTTPISRQQIEYSAGRNNYNAYWGAQMPSQQQTLNTRVETTSPLVSEPLPISTVAQQQHQQQKQNSVYGEYPPSETAASSDLNFLSNNADPFESSTLHNLEYSTAAQAASFAPKSVNQGIGNGSNEKLLQKQFAGSKSSVKQHHPSVKINLPTPQPFHHLEPLVHKSPLSPASLDKVTSEGQPDQRIAPSKTSSTEDKGASKRVYSLGDHGKSILLSAKKCTILQSCGQKQVAKTRKCTFYHRLFDNLSPITLLYQC